MRRVGTKFRFQVEESIQCVIKVKVVREARGCACTPFLKFFILTVSQPKLKESAKKNALFSNLER
jgi:hypothetical protein